MVAPQQSHFPLILNYEFIIFLLKFHLNFVYQWYNKWGVENRSEDIYIGNLKFFSSLYEVEKNFGVPDSIVKRFNEFDELYYNHVYYDNSKFIFLNNFLIGFDLDSKRFCFHKKNICIGDSIGSLKELFINSFSLWKKHNNTFIIRIEFTDTYIIFGIKNDIITSIYTWDPI
jgi:hypothetical protein